MPCYHPREILVRRKASSSSAPLVRTSWKQVVSCGRCLGCRADAGREWAMRIVHESTVSSPSWFVTLTYDPEKLPENGALRPCDVRNFIKRLRRQYAGRRIGYYLVGEYGEKNKRPHYHAVLFGAPFHARWIHRVDPAGPAWRSGTLEDAWPDGFAEFSSVNWASASYVSGYVRKKAGLKPTDYPNGYPRYDPRTGEMVNIPIEFARMSLRPAIGLRWLQKYWQDVYPADRVIMSGHEYKPPRYYDRVMTDPDPNDPTKPKHELPGITYPERLEMMEAVKARRLEEQPDLTEYKLMAMEAKHRGRVKLFNPRSKV